jgi:hypothetical protein
MSTVLVEVCGGLARVALKPIRTEVEIIDLDQLREGASEDINRYWNDSLSSRARKYVRANYPEVAGRIDA